jgi:hypothetical protein
LYPNPASASIRVRLHSVNGGSETLYLYNAAGSLLQTRIMSLEPGVNQTTLDTVLFPKVCTMSEPKSAGWVQSFVKN